MLALLLAYQYSFSCHFLEVFSANRWVQHSNMGSKQTDNYFSLKLIIPFYVLLLLITCL